MLLSQIRANEAQAKLVRFMQDNRSKLKEWEERKEKIWTQKRENDRLVSLGVGLIKETDCEFNRRLKAVDYEYWDMLQARNGLYAEQQEAWRVFDMESKMALNLSKQEDYIEPGLGVLDERVPGSPWDDTKGKFFDRT